MYLNAVAVAEEVRDAVAAASPPPSVVVLDLSMSSDLDVESVDVLDRIAEQLATEDIDLRLIGVRLPAQTMLDRAVVAGSRRHPVYATMADALADVGGSS
jgi:MFS superfamily sulfate permease-like transporter